MGLRAASVRRPNATAMAPALTETNKGQNLNLSPITIDSPANAEHDFTLPDKSPIKANYKVPTDLRNVFGSLGTLVFATELLIGEKGASEKVTGDTMSAQLNEEAQMGLSKANTTASNLLKQEKSDVEELLHNLTNDNADISCTEISSQDIAMGQNEDELFQVIKSMENSGNIGAETDPIFPLTGNDITTNLEKLFNECDMMNMSIEEPFESTPSLKETQAKELMADVQKRQVKLERRLEFLLRRIRKMQTRLMGQHVSSEIGGIYEHVHRTLRKLKDTNNLQMAPVIPNETVETPLSLLQSDIVKPQPPPEKMRPISQNSTKNLVRKLEMSALLQANASSRQKHNARYFGSGSVDSASFRNTVANVTTLPSWLVEHKQELQKVCGLLQSEYALTQEEVDSEATASSSGGESCDEMQNYTNSHQQYLNM